jgi:glycosyltransferase involved in cell wall biosynthesis
MATYNGARHIREQLRTILTQTARPAEIIVSDDGSRDDTIGVVRAVAAQTDVPIVIQSNDHRLGFSENFLQACDLASSQLIAFSDQDDRWFPDKLEVSRRALLENDAVLCVHGVDDIDLAGHFLNKNSQRISRFRVYRPLEANPWDVYYGFTMLFERSLLDRIDRGQRGADSFSPGQPLSHDRWIFFLATCFGRVVTLPQSLAGYRQHDSQLFGGPVARSVPRRIIDKLSVGGAELAYLATVADHRIGCLRNLGPEDQAAAAAAAHWERIRTVLRASSALRGEAGRRRRRSLFLCNVRRGA